jgi:hypothetical protein
VVEPPLTRVLRSAPIRHFARITHTASFCIGIIVHISLSKVYVPYCIRYRLIAESTAADNERGKPSVLKYDLAYIVDETGLLPGWSTTTGSSVLSLNATRYSSNTSSEQHGEYHLIRGCAISFIGFLMGR